MNRLYSNMTASELVAWVSCHRFATAGDAADALGISRRQYMRHASGAQPISMTLAKLCVALNRLADREGTTNP